MAWLARSIVNSLKLDDGDDDYENLINNHDSHGTSSTDGGSPSKSKAEDASQHQQIKSSLPSPTASDAQQGRGVKEDLSELTKTLTRQFWGVASFLAPPPDLSDSTSDQIAADEVEGFDAVGISGIRSDFAEIGGKFKTGISKLSSNIAVSEISKIASNFLQFGSDHDGIEGAVGVTEDVLAFARNIALHPDTWLDFPLPDDDDDEDEAEDFDMSDAQQEHALVVERLVPELTSIRIEICPEYLSEGYFWKIYFVLLHPRLDKHDALLLSTPQVMKARAMLTHELQHRVRAKPEPDYSVDTSLHEEHLPVPLIAQSEPLPLETTTVEPAHVEKHPQSNTEIKVFANLNPVSSRIMDEKYEDDGDDWLKEETTETGGISETTTIPINEEDVTFSDLEEDDDEEEEDVAKSHKKLTTYSSDSSTKDARDWVQLSRSSTDSDR